MVEPGDITTGQVQGVIDAMKLALTRFDGMGLPASQVLMRRGKESSGAFVVGVQGSLSTSSVICKGNCL